MHKIHLYCDSIFPLLLKLLKIACFKALSIYPLYIFDSIANYCKSEVPFTTGLNRASLSIIVFFDCLVFVILFTFLNLKSLIDCISEIKKFLNI